MPANTARAAALSTDVSFRPGVVVGVEILIPDGHLGLTGLQIATAHTPVLPYAVGQWIIGNDEKIEWALIEQPETGNWQAIAYNTDGFTHTFRIRFLVSDFATDGGAVSLLRAPLVL